MAVLKTTLSTTRFRSCLCKDAWVNHAWVPQLPDGIGSAAVPLKTLLLIIFFIAVVRREGSTFHVWLKRNFFTVGWLLGCGCFCTPPPCYTSMRYWEEWGRAGCVAETERNQLGKLYSIDRCHKKDCVAFRFVLSPFGEKCEALVLFSLSIAF